MRFTDATPSLTDVARVYVGQFLVNATAFSERVVNESIASFASLDELTGAKVVDAITVAVEPGKPVSILAGVVLFLLVAKHIAVRQCARNEIALHAKLE